MIAVSARDFGRQYDVWWASLPRPIGRRPVLLLGRSSSFVYLSRLLVVEVTTTIRHIPQEIALGPREGLRYPSVANLDNVRTLPQQYLTEKIGRLGRTRELELKRALGHVLHWPELTGL